METQSPKILYYKDENSQLEIQIYGDTVVLHSEIFNWKLSVLKNCYRVLNTLFEELRSKGFVRAIALTPNPAFSRLFGGVSVDKFIYEKKEHEVMIWELK